VNTTHYWLFKAEPHIYGIEHLRSAPNSTGQWNGIRNFQARNFLRDQVSLGDKLFIYHSSCKQVGIVGTAQVTRTAYPDPTQFDPQSDYYDPKASPDNVRWVAVDIQLLDTFPNIISLATLKNQAALTQMSLFKQSRLSIQPVREEEWDFVLSLR
jgi:predicted RNA-binding protein with PUA-like domain